MLDCSIQIKLTNDFECRAILRQHFPPVVDARGGETGMSQPLLDLGDVGLMVKRLDGDGGAQRM